MYMRYAGGGVGHYRVTLTDIPANPNETQEVFAVDEEAISENLSQRPKSLHFRIVYSPKNRIAMARAVCKVKKKGLFCG